MLAVDALIVRLDRQLDALPLIVDGVDAGLLGARPAPEEWSAREHLAHLARHQAVFLERTRRMLAENRPPLGRYLAERDPQWPAWSALALDEILERLRALRAELVELVRSLSPGDLARTGLHPGFGEIDLARWLQFFLLHEAHHLYGAMVTIARVQTRAVAGDTRPPTTG